MLGIMAFLSVVIFASYSANLISMLLTVNVEFPFNNYHSFYYDSNYEFGHVSGSSFDELFQVSMENCSSFSQLKSSAMYIAIFISSQISCRMAQNYRGKCIMKDGKIFKT